MHAAHNSVAAGTFRLSRRQTLVQLPGSAFLASLAGLLAAEQLSTAVPPAAAAPGPRQLDAETKAAVAAALNKIVTKAKVRQCTHVQPERNVLHVVSGTPLCMHGVLMCTHAFKPLVTCSH